MGDVNPYPAAGESDADDDGLLVLEPWSLRAPGWSELDNAQGPATFVHADIDGMLQISAYERDDGPYAADDQREWLAGVLVGAAIASSDRPGIRGFVAEGPIHGHWMRAWSFATGSDMLFVTLVSTVEGAAATLALGGAVVDSLRLVDVT